MHLNASAVLSVVAALATTMNGAFALLLRRAVFAREFLNRAVIKVLRVTGLGAVTARVTGREAT